MNRIIAKIFALLLVPCLVGEPATASAFYTSPLLTRQTPRVEAPFEREAIVPALAACMFGVLTPRSFIEHTYVLLKTSLYNYPGWLPYVLTMVVAATAHSTRGLRNLRTPIPGSIHDKALGVLYPDTTEVWEILATKYFTSLKHHLRHHAHIEWETGTSTKASGRIVLNQSYPRLIVYEDSVPNVPEDAPELSTNNPNPPASSVGQFVITLKLIQTGATNSSGEPLGFLAGVIHGLQSSASSAEKEKAHPEYLQWQREVLHEFEEWSATQNVYIFAMTPEGREEIGDPPFSPDDPDANYAEFFAANYEKVSLPTHGTRLMSAPHFNDPHSRIIPWYVHRSNKSTSRFIAHMARITALGDQRRKSPTFADGYRQTLQDFQVSVGQVKEQMEAGAVFATLRSFYEDLLLALIRLKTRTPELFQPFYNHVIQTLKTQRFLNPVILESAGEKAEAELHDLLASLELDTASDSLDSIENLRTGNAGIDFLNLRECQTLGIKTISQLRALLLQKTGPGEIIYGMDRRADLDMALKDYDARMSVLGKLAADPTHPQMAVPSDRKKEERVAVVPLIQKRQEIQRNLNEVNRDLIHYIDRALSLIKNGIHLQTRLDRPLGMLNKTLLSVPDIKLSYEDLRKAFPNPDKPDWRLHDLKTNLLDLVAVLKYMRSTIEDTLPIKDEPLQHFNAQSHTRFITQLRRISLLLTGLMVPLLLFGLFEWLKVVPDRASLFAGPSLLANRTFLLSLDGLGSGFVVGFGAAVAYGMARRADHDLAVLASAGFLEASTQGHKTLWTWMDPDSEKPFTFDSETASPADRLALEDMIQELDSTALRAFLRVVLEEDMHRRGSQEFFAKKWSMVRAWHWADISDDALRRELVVMIIGPKYRGTLLPFTKPEDVPPSTPLSSNSHGAWMLAGHFGWHVHPLAATLSAGIGTLAWYDHLHNRRLSRALRSFLRAA